MKLASLVALVTTLSVGTHVLAQPVPTTLSQGTVQRVYVEQDGGRAVFGIAPAPAGNTCSYFGEQLLFDIKSGVGAGMLSVLLLAKAQGGSVQVWYTDSSKPGTNETNGCTWDTMSQVHIIGLP